MCALLCQRAELVVDNSEAATTLLTSYRFYTFYNYRPRLFSIEIFYMIVTFYQLAPRASFTMIYYHHYRIIAPYSNIKFYD